MTTAHIGGAKGLSGVIHVIYFTCYMSTTPNPLLFFRQVDEQRFGVCLFWTVRYCILSHLSNALKQSL